MTSTESNNGLYFIVGALVIVAVIFGFLFLNPDKVNMDSYAFWASSEKKVDQTSVKIDENGASVTHSQTSP